MALYNQRSFERTGVLAEGEYAKLSQKLAECLSGLRIPTIRKALQFTPYQYNQHIEEAKANYDAQHAPIADPDFNPALSVMPFYLAAPFRAEYFPDFMREYAMTALTSETPMEYVPHDFGAAVIVPKEQFRTIVLAGYQLEQEVRKRFPNCDLDEISTHIEIDAHFFLPAKEVVETTDDLVLRLEVTLILD